MIKKDHLQNMSGYEKSVSVSVLSQLGVEAVESALWSLSLRCTTVPALFVMVSCFMLRWGLWGLSCCVVYFWMQVILGPGVRLSASWAGGPRHYKTQAEQAMRSKTLSSLCQLLSPSSCPDFPQWWLWCRIINWKISFPSYLAFAQGVLSQQKKS